MVDRCSLTRGRSEILKRGRSEKGAADSIAGESAMTVSAIAKQSHWEQSHATFVSSQRVCTKLRFGDLRGLVASERGTSAVAKCACSLGEFIGVWHKAESSKGPTLHGWNFLLARVTLAGSLEDQRKVCDIVRAGLDCHQATIQHFEESSVEN